jgi:hypothetical protein
VQDEVARGVAGDEIDAAEEGIVVASGDIAIRFWLPATMLALIVGVPPLTWTPPPLPAAVLPRTTMLASVRLPLLCRTPPPLVGEMVGLPYQLRPFLRWIEQYMRRGTFGITTDETGG